ncbi:MAG TPA: ATP-dependent DNA helicase [Methylomirabilota bacterium]|jgi:DNA helicase-2/ATP-dependent DNA helicase PcrA|nr:ATP-dependent DNA helicase [Methylomirabilota bacterium]
MAETPRGAERILEGLNAAQVAAVTHEAGPLLIIAGAGTGKTTVITRRIAYLIATRRARPSEILALTFTDKAAVEMEERVDTLVPYGYADVQLSTFHAFGDRLIRENALELGLTPDFRVLTRAEQVIFLRDRLFEFPLVHYRPLGDPTRHLQAILGQISRLKDEDVRPEEYLAHAESLRAQAADDESRLEADQHLELARTYAQYQTLMARQGQVDFGDQIVEALRLFRLRAHVLRRYQERFRYILVDEFQDTNYAQFELVKLLAARHRNVAVVGDDDQAIFRWRGASMSNILDFDRTYPGATKVVLQENRRSPQAILDPAYRLIQHNNPDRLEVAQRIDKRLIAKGLHGAASMGKPPEHLCFDSVSTESDQVAAMIAEEHARGRPYKDIAILVRANNDADPFLRALNMRAIPWTFSGNAGLYGRPEVRLLIAFLRTVAHPDDSISLHYVASSQIYQVPIVDLTRCATYADRRHRWLFDVLRAVPAELELSEEGRAAIGRLVADLERYMELARETPTGELLYQLLVDSGLMTRYARAPAELEQEVQNVSKFFKRVKEAARVLKYDHVREFVNHLDALIEAGDDPAVVEADTDTPAVHVLTVHKAKGLEWPVVFLVNCVQNKFPSTRRSEPIEMPAGLIKDTLPAGDFHLQEERRLFYVGMTRAKEALYLTSAEDMGGRLRWKVSQFVLEALDLPKEAARPFRSKAIEELRRHAPPPAPEGLGQEPLADSEPLAVSHNQVDDYETCPLKYHYIHILRIPLRQHHAIVYGSALHTAVEFYLRRRAAGNFTPLEDFLRAFEDAWRNEGFLTREHEEQRKRSGIQSLTRFYHEEEAAGLKPAAIEQEFGFELGPTRVRGRLDRVDETPEGAVIVDYKSSDVTEQKKADQRARESLQLKIYALAWKAMTGRLPVAVELRFLDSGLIGRHRPTEEDLAEAREAIEAAARGIRRRRFDATPTYQACRYCPYNQICPSTATQE